MASVATTMLTKRTAGYGNVRDRTTMTIGTNMMTAAPSHTPWDAAIPSISPGVMSPANSRNTSPRRYVSISDTHKPERMILTLGTSDNVFSHHTVDVENEVGPVCG